MPGRQGLLGAGSSSSSRLERRRVPHVYPRYAGVFSALARPPQAGGLPVESRSPPRARRCPSFTNLVAMARQKAVLPRDPGLATRMVLTMFLLGLLYVVFIVVLLQAGGGLVTVVVVMGALSLAQLFLSDKLALSAMGAKVVSPQEAPGLH